MREDAVNQSNGYANKAKHTGWVAPMECFRASPVALLMRAKLGKPSSSFTLVLYFMSLIQCCQNTLPVSRPQEKYSDPKFMIHANLKPSNNYRDMTVSLQISMTFYIS